MTKDAKDLLPTLKRFLEESKGNDEDLTVEFTFQGESVNFNGLIAALSLSSAIAVNETNLIDTMSQK